MHNGTTEALPSLINGSTISARGVCYYSILKCIIVLLLTLTLEFSPLLYKLYKIKLFLYLE